MNYYSKGFLNDLKLKQCCNKKIKFGRMWSVVSINVSSMGTCIL